MWHDAMKHKFLKVEDAGNPPDVNCTGCVPYVYEIARTSLSNSDWCEFLNHMEGDNANGFYHKDMTSGVLGGIIRNGDEYLAKSGWEKKPVVYVNYISLVKYCNWLESGDAEAGAYDLSFTPPKRVVGAHYFLPTDDEWYKAAYYDPREKRYWRYPTCSDDQPSLGQANYECGDELSVGPPYYLADVDDFGDTPSPWGAVQMGGNAWEYLEDCYEKPLGNKLRGGSFGYTETGLSSLNTDFGRYNGRCYVFGGRLVHFPDGWHPIRKPIKYAIMMSIKKWEKRAKSFARRLQSFVCR